MQLTLKSNIPRYYNIVYTRLGNFFRLYLMPHIFQINILLWYNFIGLIIQTLHNRPPIQNYNGIQINIKYYIESTQLGETLKYPT